MTRTKLRLGAQLFAAGFVLSVLATAGCQLIDGPNDTVVMEVPLGEAYEWRPTQVAHSIRIDLADQESEGFHFKVPEKALAGGTVDHWSFELVDAPNGDEAPVTVPASGLDRFFLTPHFYDCLTVENPLAPAAQETGTPEHVPDALLPMLLTGDEFHSALPTSDKRASRHVWVELTWRLDAAAIEADASRRLKGTQHFKITGYDANGVRRVELGCEAHFRNFSLPVTGRFRTMLNWNTTIAGFYGWPEVSPEMRRMYYDFFLQYRLSPTSFHNQTMEPSIEDLAFCAARGQNAVNLYTLERQKGPLPQAETDAIKRIADAAKPALEQNRLQNSAFVLVCNSAEESDIDSITANADAVHTDYPWAKVWMFAAPSEPLASRINAWTTLTVADTAAFQPISFDAEARKNFAGARDLNLWYVGPEPLAPQVNLLLSNRPFDAHVLALQTWANDINGLVIPHATAWPWARAAEMKFPIVEWRARRDGYGLLCYPLPDGRPCPSVRWTNLRDGLEHAEALRTADLLIYNLDTETKLFEKITLPLLLEQLKSFDNIGHTDDLRKKIEDKLTLTQVQLASIPPVLDGLRAIVEEYKATFQAVDAKP
ncbi:MAG TPA: glycoside hydrolase domain-containing protein, partial [Planctomycetota bacterium]|nr:glycoside hydrolase domain-containing protein [Planctomycetota bacterium]